LTPEPLRPLTHHGTGRPAALPANPARPSNPHGHARSQHSKSLRFQGIATPSATPSSDDPGPHQTPPPPKTTPPPATTRSAPRPSGDHPMPPQITHSHPAECLPSWTSQAEVRGS
jgi:hypothetical protein